MLVILSLLVARPAVMPVVAQSPSIRYSEDETSGYSPAEFQRVLSLLKAEREALDADWKSLTKRLSAKTPGSEPDLDKLQEQLRKTLARLQADHGKPASMPPFLPGQSVPVKPGQATSEENKKTRSESPSASAGTPSAASTNASPDVVHLAQTLFRAERYEEALAVFQGVDLKGKKAQERAPILYFTALCLHQLGKTDDGLTLLREVANSRGDERLAGYAQWQIENLRWHRETQGRLQDVRQRLLAVEKR